MRAKAINKSDKFKEGVTLHWITNGAIYGTIIKVMKNTVKISRCGSLPNEIMCKEDAIKMILTQE